MKTIVIITCILLGTLLHFTYNLSKCNKIVGLFSATNESTWEHLKLSYFPIILVGIIEYILLKNTSSNIITSKLIASIIAMSTTVVLFYTYTGIIGKNYAIIDISIFIIGIIISELISYNIIQLQPLHLEPYSFILIIFILIIFFIFTNNPPHLNIFKDPITKQYEKICKYSK